MSKTKTLRYVAGREYAPVVETAACEQSVFAGQYARALRIVERHVAAFEGGRGGGLHVVAFAGERGTGKTSAMATVAAILREKARYEGFREAFPGLRGKRFACLDLLDPSFFDRRHNVVELVLGQMYASVEKGDDDYARHDELMQAFARAKRCLDNVHLQREQTWDALQDLHDIAAGVALRGAIEELVAKYLAHEGRDVLVVSIDDIDLNMSQAYAMCEQVRKYLGIRSVVVLMAVRLSQIESVVRGTLKKRRESDSSPEDYALMARRYVEKLLPAACHVAMPRVHDLADTLLDIGDGEPQEVARAVVELIYDRTGYLFYNGRGQASPIVPDNLRALMSLVGLLVALPKRAVAHEANKEVFRNYFFGEWTWQLGEKGRRGALSLVGEPSPVALNKRAVALLAPMVDPRAKRFDGDDPKAATGELAKAICHKANFAHNVSVGDVFRLLSLLEADSLTRPEEQLLFFVKSFYSMRLYETYDSLVGALAGGREKGGTNDGTVYKSDRLLAAANALQRLLGGAFFTYNPGELLKRDKGDRTFDRRLIDNLALGDLLAALYKERDKKSGEESFWQRFRLAEFFVLTTVGRVLADYGDAVSFQGRFRRDVEPFALLPYKRVKGKALFDALWPFAAMVNVEGVYARYKDVFPGLYAYALASPFSLLRQMMATVRATRRHIGGETPAADLHRLLSDAVVRNGDVLAAMYEKIRSERRQAHSGANATDVAQMYRRIVRSGMCTYDEAGGQPVEIAFHFLEPLADVLDKAAKEGSDEWTRIFDGEATAESHGIATRDDVVALLKGTRQPRKIRERLAALEELKGQDPAQLVPEAKNGKSYQANELKKTIDTIWAVVGKREAAEASEA